VSDYLPLPREFYGRGTSAVARELLGKLLVRRRPEGGVQTARIVEVEAYLGQKDAASHARRGPTPRAAIMFGPPGFLYVYFIYGMHHCLNLAVEREGTAGCVLIRAAEPVAGLEPGSCRGPGRLCRALGLDTGDSGGHVFRRGSRLVLREGRAPERVAVTPRIGIRLAAERPLRFFDEDSAEVSGPRRRPRG
jgi:DNA-3-methyladenine glycosylase